MVEEFLNSVWLSSKVLDGMLLIIPMLSHTSLARDKAVASSIRSAVATMLFSQNSVLEEIEVVLLTEEQVANALTITRLMAVDTSSLILTMIAIMPMLRTMLDSLSWKSMEEVPKASVSLVILTQENPVEVLLPSASNTNALEADQTLKFKLSSVTRE